MTLPIDELLKQIRHNLKMHSPAISAHQIRTFRTLVRASVGIDKFSISAVPAAPSAQNRTAVRPLAQAFEESAVSSKGSAHLASH